MSAYSLTTLYVVPVGNTLPTTGSTENLTAGQFGVFKDLARTAATAANIGTATFIQFSQGPASGSYLPSKYSDKIKSTKVKNWYKVTGNGSASNEIWQVSDFTVKKGEDVTITVRGHSSYLDTISFNGFTRSITVPGDCFECGDDPCTDSDNEAIIDAILAVIAQQNAAQNGLGTLNLSSFFIFYKTGTGADAVLNIESKPLTAYGQPCDLAADPYEFDRIWFKVWVTKGPETSVDFIVADACDTAATTTLIQRSSFPRGVDTEIAQLEKDYYSYQSPFKHLFRLPGYDPYFVSYVTAGTVYDTYVITFDELLEDSSWTPNLKEDERVIIAVPTGSLSTGLNTVLTAYLGAPTDASGPVVTTTTTTSTTSTTTTSTTQAIP